jgi:hypothetical protein
MGEMTTRLDTQFPSNQKLVNYSATVHSGVTAKRPDSVTLKDLTGQPKERAFSFDLVNNKAYEVVELQSGKTLYLQMDPNMAGISENGRYIYYNDTTTGINGDPTQVEFDTKTGKLSASQLKEVKWGPKPDHITYETEFVTTQND